MAGDCQNVSLGHLEIICFSHDDSGRFLRQSRAIGVVEVRHALSVENVSEPSQQMTRVGVFVYRRYIGCSCYPCLFRLFLPYNAFDDAVLLLVLHVHTPSNIMLYDILLRAISNADGIGGGTCGAGERANSFAAPRRRRIMLISGSRLVAYRVYSSSPIC